MDNFNSVSACPIYYLVYKTTNIINNLIYVGQHIQQETSAFDGYLGSGVLFLSAVNEHGKENFTREIIEYCSSGPELGKRETYWIEALSATDRSIGYNLMKGYEGCGIVSEETKLKLSNALKGKPKSEEHKRKLSESHKRKHLSKEHRKHLSEALKGDKNPMYQKHHSLESNRKNRDSHIGKHPSEETRRKQSKSKKGNKNRLGHKTSEKTKLKMSKASKGKPKSKEHRKHISESKKGNKNPMYGKYKSLKTISKDL